MSFLLFFSFFFFSKWTQPLQNTARVQYQMSADFQPDTSKY